MQGRSVQNTVLVRDTCQSCRLTVQQAFTWDDWPENYPLPEGWEQMQNNYLLCEKCNEQT